MLIVRGTKKLRDRMKQAPQAAPDDASTTSLGDWFATALFWKPQAALLVNTQTMIPVFTPLAPASKLLDRAPGSNRQGPARTRRTRRRSSTPNLPRWATSASHRPTTADSSA